MFLGLGFTKCHGSGGHGEDGLSTLWNGVSYYFCNYHGTSVGWKVMTKERQFSLSLLLDFHKRWDKCNKQQFIYLTKDKVL